MSGATWKQKMNSDDNSPSRFEVALRLLGNEVIAFSLIASDIRSRYVIWGSVIAALGVAAISYLGLVSS